MRYVFPKGYIALNGVSLTIGEVDRSRNEFRVYLIPETLRLTNLGQKKAGDTVNLEIETQTRNMVDTVSEISKETING
jgi:riboflavin synthase